jgi:predicted MPP superfamily phosphohydrolase
MVSILTVLTAIIALNAELDKSKHFTLTALFFPYHSEPQQIFTATITSIYIATVAHACQHRNRVIDTMVVAVLGVLSSFIFWEDIIFGISHSPEVSTLSLLSYNALGALLCLCVIKFVVGKHVYILTTLLVLLHLYIHSLGPVVREINISGMPGAVHGTRIIHLSDLHIGPTCRRACTEEIVTATTHLHADLVVITGDIIDGPVAVYKESAAPLSKLKPPTIMITGNHDYMHGEIDNVLQLMTSLGIIPLLNEAMTTSTGLSIFGVDDEWPNTSQNNATLILVHRPTLARKFSSDNRLILAGHTHCGQMLPAMPFVWAASYPYFCGLYTTASSHVYVSAGSGNWGPTMRLWHRAEIVVHTLSSQ